MVCLFFVQQALVCLMVDQANGSGRVGSCVKTGSGKNGSIKKGVVSILVETGLGRNGFGSEPVSGQNRFRVRSGRLKMLFFKECTSWGQFCRVETGPGCFGLSTGQYFFTLNPCLLAANLKFTGGYIDLHTVLRNV
ncbi:hypothetical protein HanPSC8_Chr13g0571041 [Helianthus annuus]|nr:hypothetical protein HanPSC8_Chr13g0571041 [Helianthus annuus]